MCNFGRMELMKTGRNVVQAPKNPDDVQTLGRRKVFSNVPICRLSGGHFDQPQINQSTDKLSRGPTGLKRRK